jgi:hypothetical protein
MRRRGMAKLRLPQQWRGWSGGAEYNSVGASQSDGCVCAQERKENLTQCWGGWTAYVDLMPIVAAHTEAGHHASSAADPPPRLMAGPATGPLGPATDTREKPSESGAATITLTGILADNQNISDCTSNPVCSSPAAKRPATYDAPLLSKSGRPQRFAS